MKIEIEVPQYLLDRVRDHVARESLAGRQTTVDEVIERALATLDDARKAKTRG